MWSSRSFFFVHRSCVHHLVPHVENDVMSTCEINKSKKSSFLKASKKKRVKFISGVQNQISAHFHSFTKFLTFQSLLMFETILISCSTIYTNHFTCLYNNVALPLFVKSHFQCSIFFVHICCS